MFGWILRMFSRNAPLPVPQPSLCAGRGRGREGGNTLREVDQMWKGRPSQRCRQPAALLLGAALATPSLEMQKTRVMQPASLPPLTRRRPGRSRAPLLRWGCSAA